MRAVVLGSTGFFGRTIVAELARRGHAVVGYSREGAPCPEAPAAAFDRLHPEWQLSARHPYIKARADQQRRVHADAGAVRW